MDRLEQRIVKTLISNGGSIRRGELRRRMSSRDRDDLPAALESLLRRGYIDRVSDAVLGVVEEALPKMEKEFFRAPKKSLKAYPTHAVCEICARPVVHPLGAALCPRCHEALLLFRHEVGLLASAISYLSK